MKMKKKDRAEAGTRCDSCLYYDADENGEYYCTMQYHMDEDERVVMSRRGAVCPYFRFYDEYLSVRKQN